MSGESTNITADEDVLREGPARFLAFASRATRLLAPYSQQVRYLAFSSDVGEAARPVVHPKLVTASYGLTWLYVFGDTAFEGFHQWQHTPADGRKILDKVTRTFTFQLLASVALPFLIIHKSVSVSGRLLQRYVAPKYTTVHKWAPSAVGLGLIPALPVAVDHPVEQAVDWAFNTFDPLSAHKINQL
jgi:fission process protein 1